MEQATMVVNKEEFIGRRKFADRSSKDKPYEWGFGSTPRTAKLRGDIFSKSTVVKDWEDALTGRGVCTFRKQVKMDMDLARLITLSHKETEGQPWVVRRAKSMYKICDEIPIYIKTGELIVGCPNSAPDEVRWHPDVSVSYIPDGIKKGFKDLLTEEEKKEVVDDIYGYWKDKSLEAEIMESLPQKVKPFASMGTPESRTAFASNFASGRNVVYFDFDRLFEDGLEKRIAKAEKNLAELDESEGEIDPVEYLKKRNGWKAMAIAGRGVLRYAERYAQLAENLAAGEKDKNRKKELGRMAEICSRVPAKPPRNFQECLQFYWFIDVTARYMEGPNVGCGARLDQIWYPYYKKDIEEGRINEDEALELIECLLLKIDEVGNHVEFPDLFTMSSGGSAYYTANIGGSNPDGSDASNELTCLILEALANVRTSQPPIAFRYHKNVSPLIIDKAIDLCRIGMGHPAFFNEKLIEKWALNRGYSLEDARNCSPAGCVVPAVKGKFLNSSMFTALGFINHARFLELALHQGVDKFSGKQVGPRTPDPAAFKSAQDLLEAMKEQLRFAMKKYVAIFNIAYQTVVTRRPYPLTSLLLDGSLNEGIDCTELSTRYDTYPNFDSGGYTNIADSLTAVQKVVFDDRNASMAELVEALKNNWEGKEDLRQLCLRAPKHGNDDDYADYWLALTHNAIVDVAEEFKDPWGNKWTMDGSWVIAYQALAMGLGATPDGRKDGDYCADGSISPMPGRDTRGPTAVVRSVSKIPYRMTQLLNQRFMPMFLEGENKQHFASYLKAWGDMDASYHVQFNVVNSELLREAQTNPENHSNLLVRVAGYSAYFVDLPKETQDSIIARTEQRF